MKKIMLIVAVFATTISFGQSNEAGTIHARFGVGFDISSGKSTFTPKDVDPGEPSEYTYGQGAAGAFYGISAGYGLADAFSAGIFIKKIGLVVVSTDNGFDDGGEDNVISGWGFGINGNWYAVNKDKFNFYLSPCFGYAPLSSTDTYNGVSKKQSMGGLIYGLNAGINVYFGGKAGMFFDLGYTGKRLSSSYEYGDQSLGLGGVEFSLGLAMKFGN